MSHLERRTSSSTGSISTAFSWIKDRREAGQEWLTARGSVDSIRARAHAARIDVTREQIRLNMARFLQWMNGEITDHQLKVYLDGRKLTDRHRLGGE